MQPPGQISGNNGYRPRTPQQPPTPPPAPDVRGRHRKRAELSRLNQEIRALQVRPGGAKGARKSTSGICWLQRAGEIHRELSRSVCAELNRSAERGLAKMV